MANTFVRPDISKEDLGKAQKLANLILNQPRFKMVAAVVVLVVENMRLAKECNIHREAGGYELLPIHDPKF